MTSGAIVAVQRLADAHPVTLPAPWPAASLAEARAVVADVARHSDHLIWLACRVLSLHGVTEAERRDARALLFVLDARRPFRRAQREDAVRRVGP